jgi:L-alanine-DL-glutamate epimerase-like enolase superfamily enzyme
MTANEHRIESVHFFRVKSPLSQPIADATHTISDITFIVVRLTLASGLTGDGHLLAFHYSPGAIAGTVTDIREYVVGRPVYETGKLAADWNFNTEYFGSPGLQRWALGLVNVAMWDAWAKSLGQPIWKLFGTQHARVPVYGSGGWLSYSTEELLAEAKAYVQRGFRAVKIKVGSPDVEQDIERLTKVREAVGPRVQIMMDANQGLDYPRALRLAHAAQPIGIGWFEEPFPNTDFEQYAQLRANSALALAMGEREYDTTALRELISRRAIDLWQPDILRLGGVEGWRASAALAQAYGIPVLPHYYKEYDVPLLCTIDRAYGAESFDWAEGVIDHHLTIKDGYAYPIDRPGWGFSFKDDSLSHEI